MAALEGLQGVGFTVPGVTGDVNSEVGKLATVPVGAGNDALGRSRGDVGPHGRRLQPAHGDPRRRARLPGTRPTAVSRRSCNSRPRCSPPVSARASSRSTGAASTPTATSSPGRTRSSRRCRAPWPRSRPTSPHAAWSRTSSRWCSRSSGAVSRSRTRRAPTTARAARSCSAARPSGAGSRASTRASTSTRTAISYVKTDFRTVYQALIAEWLGGDPTAILPGGPFPGVARSDGGTTLMKAA